MGRKMDPRFTIKYWQNPLNSDRASYWLVMGSYGVGVYGSIMAIFRTRDEAEAWIQEQEGK